MVGSHHPFNGHEFEQTPEDRSLVFCSPWGHKERDDLVTVQQQIAPFSFSSLLSSFVN